MEPLKPLNQSVPADGDPADFQPLELITNLKPSPELSILLSTRNDTIKTRKIAILAADGCDDTDLNAVTEGLTAAGAQVKIVAPRLGYLQTKGGADVKIHFSLLTASSVLFDAVYVPGGADSIAALNADPAAREFIAEAYKHAKAIAVSASGAELLPSSSGQDQAVIVSENGAAEKLVSDFIAAIAKHRNWDREKMLRPEEKKKKKAV